jgi:hypothetical protein
LKIANCMLAAAALVLGASAASAQAGAGAAPGKPAGAQAPAPMVLNSIDATTKADPFPPVNPKYFTAATPTVETVESFLKQL